jgi:hypothetical protein
MGFLSFRAWLTLLKMMFLENEVVGGLCMNSTKTLGTQIASFCSIMHSHSMVMVAAEAYCLAGMLQGASDAISFC